MIAAINIYGLTLPGGGWVLIGIPVCASPLNEASDLCFRGFSCLVSKGNVARGLPCCWLISLFFPSQSESSLETQVRMPWALQGVGRAGVLSRGLWLCGVPRRVCLRF